jgi:predicted enzyme related to lactoylglutathione lyase
VPLSEAKGMVIKMNRVIHFEIHAAGPTSLGKFCTIFFGWKVEEWVIPGVKDETVTGQG